jgi:GTP-binding protein EngB required for normal cell division
LYIQFFLGAIKMLKNEIIINNLLYKYIIIKYTMFESFMKYSENLLPSKSSNNIADTLKKLSDSKIIQINNELNGIFNEQIKLPRIVVVGGQSSGKSSVLNNIITMNILPTGSEMVTRSPLSIELSPIINNQQASVEFGSYIATEEISSSAWKTHKNIKVSYPEPTHDELNLIKNEIEKITNIIAGGGKNISHQPINIKIFLPNVPNLTLIDLPGITQIACKDKGQPDDIKEQIEKLIGSYIESNETIILSVIPARSDVEADVGVGLTKKYDPNFSRSIGVLTKIDLMNIDTDVADYVKGNISKNLKMNYGYYLVRNRSNKEMISLTMKEGFDKENEFFNSHGIYSKLSQGEKTKLGTGQLRDKLVYILSEKIKECLPIITKQINEKYDSVCKELIMLGSEVPSDILGKQTYINHLIINFYQKFTQILEGNDKENYNIGRRIKDGFVKYRSSINKINPIQEMDINYIDEITKNIEGNHMTFFIPSISVFETCIIDNKYKPVQKLLQPSLNCVKENIDMLSKMVSDILNDTNNEIYRYPSLLVYLENKIITQIILPFSEKTSENIINLINMEESYIWTDSEIFNNKINDMMKGKISNIETNTIKILLVEYYNTIKENIKNNIPKAIMLHLIHRLKNEILHEIMKKIDMKEITNLLNEGQEIKIKRDDLILWRNKLSFAREKLNN